MEDRRSARQRGYNSRWERARKTYLTNHPLCVMCQAQGRVEPATVVDHKIPHRGDQKLFWDNENNWQSLCASCHSSGKQQLEIRGFSSDTGLDGWPLDPKHPANRLR